MYIILVSRRDPHWRFITFSKQEAKPRGGSATYDNIIPYFCHPTISESRIEPRDIETKITRKDTELRQTFQTILTDNFTSINLQLKMVNIVHRTEQ